MRRLDGFILGLLIAALLAGLAVVSWVTISSAERVLLPQLDRKAEAAAKSVASLVRQGLADGLTLDKLYGVDSVLVAAVSEAREFAFAALSTADGRLIEAAARDPAGVAPLRPLPQGPPADLLTSRAPVVVDGVEVAGVLVGVPPSVVEEAVRRLWLDIAVVLLVSALVALELLSFVQGLPMGASFRGVAERLEALRRGDLRRHPPLAEDGRFGAVAERIDGSLETVNSRQEALVRTATLRQDPEALGALAALERRFALGRARPSLGPAALVRAPLFLFYFAEELTRPFLPNFIAGLSSPIAGLSAELVISLPIVLFMAIVALSQPVLGGLTERIGRGRAFRAGAAAGVVGFVGTAYAQDLRGAPDLPLMHRHRLCWYIRGGSRVHHRPHRRHQPGARSGPPGHRHHGGGLVRPADRRPARRPARRALDVPRLGGVCRGGAGLRLGDIAGRSGAARRAAQGPRAGRRTSAPEPADAGSLAPWLRPAGQAHAGRRLLFSGAAGTGRGRL